MPSQSYRAAREAKQLRALQAAAAAAGTGLAGNTMFRNGAPAGSNGSAAVPLSARDDDSPVEYRPETPSDFTTDDDEDEKELKPRRGTTAVPIPAATRAVPFRVPSAKYMNDLAMPSHTVADAPKPKSKLLVSDLDNTLFGPSVDGVVARPYLKTFLRYIMHPESPYALAIWTFSGRMWGLAHLRQVGMGSLLFDSDDKLNPKLKPGLLAVWGFEDSGFLPNDTMPGGTVKDLSLMWEMLNIANGSDWSPFDSLIVDDQRTNARAQPDSLVNCPVFTKRSYDDEFLLAFIGVLDALSRETNIADSIRRLGLYRGIPPVDLARYVAKGKSVCDSMSIKVSRGTPYPDPTILSSLGKPSGMRRLAPVHDAADEDATAIVSGLGQDSATPSLPVPKRVADGMPLAPTKAYLAQVDIPSRATAPDGRPRLVVFDLDGTLYHRPPQYLEHFAAGEPAGRPYLRSMLTWLLRPESPWTVAIWTGSQKQTAVECLCELGLGLVGPKLVGHARDQAELLHPKLVALWAREDFGLTRKDFYSYVAVVKDLSRLWRHLNIDLHLGPFDVENTVMVDDTPEKLRAQPFSLVAAPTFDYPLGPSLPTYKAQLDAFLLALVAVLYHLECESNIANYIRAGNWNITKSQAKLQVCRAKGVELLQSAGILVAAEGRGRIPNAVTPGRSSDLTRFGNASAVPLTASRLAALTGSASHAGVTSDTDNTETTEDSINGDSPDSEQEGRQPAANGTESLRKLQERRDRASEWRRRT